MNISINKENGVLNIALDGRLEHIVYRGIKCVRKRRFCILGLTPAKRNKRGNASILVVLEAHSENLFKKLSGFKLLGVNRKHSSGRGSEL